MSPVRLLKSRAVAEMLGVTVDLLSNWRAKGIGPRFYALGPRNIRYGAEEVEAWLESKQSTTHGHPATQRQAELPVSVPRERRAGGHRLGRHFTKQEKGKGYGEIASRTNRPAIVGLQPDHSGTVQ